MSRADDLRALIGAPTEPARKVACPWCGAPPYAPCATRAGRRLTSGLHPARQAAHREAS